MLAIVLSVGLLAAGVWFFGIRHGDGPLGESGLGNQLCFPVGESESATIGTMDTLRNSSSSIVKITDVSLIGARGVENAGAFLVQGAATSKSGWAFGNGPFDGEANRPRLAVDAELPAKSDDDIGLIVHLTRPDVLAEGYVEGIRIEYTTGDRRYFLETGPEQILRPGKCF
ncbi:hypothetical protein E1263_11580 [Kribbella antibiotica]|uniref:Uncharacterized protein n=1 Tax=Kribbella antibiotica TaxID=190195 RepID=A0A4V2YQ08_9ACTN|nr:hypothetical protein [Kribbella antibiotica]TDD60257.1 hypothetical protein E1263_11580 [Kribbella antibiotica]